MDKLNDNLLLQLFDPQRNKVETFKYWLFVAGGVGMIAISVMTPTKQGFGNLNTIKKYLTGASGLFLFIPSLGCAQELGKQWAKRNMTAQASTDIFGGLLEIERNSIIYDRTQELAAKYQPPQLPPAEEYRSLPPSEPDRQIDAEFEEIEEEPQQVLSLKASQPDRASQRRDNTAAKLEKAFANYGLDLEWKNSIVGPTFIRHRLLPDRSVVVDDILRRQKDIGRAMGLEKAPIISIDREYIAIDFPRPDRQIVAFEDYISYNPQPILPVKVAIGIDLNGHLIEIDLSDPDSCHVLVGGMTGGGKTEFIKAVGYSACAKYTPDIVQLIMVDPKRTKFKEFANCPNLAMPIIKDVSEGIEAMENLVTEMEDRYQTFEEAGCENIDEYVTVTQSAMPRLLVLFDEFANFMIDKSDKKEFEASVKQLSAKARESGIHLFLATQRPDRTVVTPLIRDNLPVRIALRVKSEGNSKIIFGDDNTSAIDLLGKGDMFYSGCGELLRLQSLYARNISFGQAPIAASATTKSTHELIEDAWLEE